MRDRDHARLLLVMAGKDLQAIEGMRDADRFAIEIFGFHAQQAVEKALKAWCCLVGVVYPRIHDLEELIGLLEDAGVRVPERFQPLGDLTDFAVWSRYQPCDGFDAQLDRATVVHEVHDLVAHVATLLGAGDEPVDATGSRSNAQ